ncbi:unnamed protein product, partial [Ectocarpus sp. 8 AP-2014]
DRPFPNRWQRDEGRGGGTAGVAGGGTRKRVIVHSGAFRGHTVEYPWVSIGGTLPSFS